jgi:hypothetical protein
MGETVNIRRGFVVGAAVCLAAVGAVVAARPGQPSRQPSTPAQTSGQSAGEQPIDIIAGLTSATPAQAPRSRATTHWPPQDWPWPPSMESVKSAWRNHKILWENNKVRLIEVTIRPGETEAMHDHPYDSIFAFDSPWPAGAMTDNKLVQDDPRNAPLGGRAGAPTGKQFPTCASAGPQAPHQVTNHGDFPIHFYRVEFKRVDGDGLYTNWKQWYPWMLDPLKPVKDVAPDTKGAPFSKDFPYPIAFDSVHAAPNNHYIRYEDEHVRFLEVVFRPGETENLHGHPYPSVFANDSVGSVGELLKPPAGGKPLVKDHPLNPADPRNAPIGGSTPGPKGEAFPTCTTMDPQAPHQATDLASFPIHFYRLEFKRIDGDDIKTKWKEWHYDVLPPAPAGQ